ncbi:MAG: ComF family protein [Clostridia bacterium]|nr:ComF family protein [Clostridia bacterium]
MVNMFNDKVLMTVLGSYEFVCVSCGLDIFDDGEYLCAECRAQLYLNNGKTCLRCGCAIGGDSSYCTKCGDREVFFDKAVSPIIAQGLATQLLYKLKYGNRHDMARLLAHYMADSFVKQNLDIDIVTYVPLHERDEKTRGYNQSALLAKQFCAILGIDNLQHLLSKNRVTVQQEKLGYEQRLVNLQGAFSVNKDIVVKGKNILLIDDCLTTGATTSQCAKVLKQAKCAKVYVLTAMSRKDKATY